MGTHITVIVWGSGHIHVHIYRCVHVQPEMYPDHYENHVTGGEELFFPLPPCHKGHKLLPTWEGERFLEPYSFHLSFSEVSRFYICTLTHWQHMGVSVEIL